MATFIITIASACLCTIDHHLIISLRLVKKRSIVHKYQSLSKEKSRCKAKSMKEKVNVKKEKFSKEVVQNVGIYTQCTVDSYKKWVMTENDFEILSSGNWPNYTIANCT